MEDLMEEYQSCAACRKPLDETRLVIAVEGSGSGSTVCSWACALRLCARALSTRFENKTTAAAAIRRCVDDELEVQLGERLSADTMPRADRALLEALVRLDEKQGEPFRTNRAQMAVEAGVRPVTLSISLYRLERDGWIRRDAKPGQGTTITVLRRP